jgi:hypothetical protein
MLRPMLDATSSPLERVLTKLRERYESIVSLTDAICIDIRTAPREIQELAVAKGLVPYLPGAGRDAAH